jgi:hypothetical protein
MRSINNHSIQVIVSIRFLKGYISILPYKFEFEVKVENEAKDLAFALPGTTAFFMNLQ